MRKSMRASTMTNFGLFCAVLSSKSDSRSLDFARDDAGKFLRFQKGLPDYKPVFVSATCAADGNHSSWPEISPRLQRPTRKS